MASENHTTSCLDDPNFATICSFLEKFGELCHLVPIPFAQLQEMLENTNEVPVPLVQLHIRLLRRVFKSINTGKWEKSVSKFAHMFNSQDGWEVERFGYKKSKMQTKLRILKNLLESQFDYNVKFKGEVNKLLASDLRMVPLGRDQEGHAYWYQVDAEANLRVYREDVDDETWEIVASSREEMEQLISQLKVGEIRKGKSAEDIVIEEEMNGVENLDIETKEILQDTGKPTEEPDDNPFDDDSDDAMEIADDLPDVPDSFDDESLSQQDSDLNITNQELDSSTPDINLPSTLPEEKSNGDAVTSISSTVISDSIAEPTCDNDQTELSVSASVTSDKMSSESTEQDVEHKTLVQSKVSEEISKFTEVHYKKEVRKDRENTAPKVHDLQPNTNVVSNNLSNLQKLNAMVDMFSSTHPIKPKEEPKLNTDKGYESQIASTSDVSPYFNSKLQVEREGQDIIGAPVAPPYKVELPQEDEKSVVELKPAGSSGVNILSEKIVPKVEDVSRYFQQSDIVKVDGSKLAAYPPEQEIVSNLCNSEKLSVKKVNLKSGESKTIVAQHSPLVKPASESTLASKQVVENLLPPNETPICAHKSEILPPEVPIKHVSEKENLLKNKKLLTSPTSTSSGSIPNVEEDKASRIAKEFPRSDIGRTEDVAVFEKSGSCSSQNLKNYDTIGKPDPVKCQNNKIDQNAAETESLTEKQLEGGISVGKCSLPEEECTTVPLPVVSAVDASIKTISKSETVSPLCSSVLQTQSQPTDLVSIEFGLVPEIKSSSEHRHTSKPIDLEKPQMVKMKTSSIKESIGSVQQIEKQPALEIISLKPNQHEVQNESSSNNVDSKIVPERKESSSLEVVSNTILSTDSIGNNLSELPTEATMEESTAQKSSQSLTSSSASSFLDRASIDNSAVAEQLSSSVDSLSESIPTTPIQEKINVDCRVVPLANEYCADTGSTQVVVSDSITPTVDPTLGLKEAGQSLAAAVPIKDTSQEGADSRSTPIQFETDLSKSADDIHIDSKLAKPLDAKIVDGSLDIQESKASTEEKGTEADPPVPTETTDTNRVVPSDTISETSVKNPLITVENVNAPASDAKSTEKSTTKASTQILEETGNLGPAIPETVIHQEIANDNKLKEVTESSENSSVESRSTARDPDTKNDRITENQVSNPISAILTSEKPDEASNMLTDTHLKSENVKLEPLTGEGLVDLPSQPEVVSGEIKQESDSVKVTTVEQASPVVHNETETRPTVSLTDVVKDIVKNDTVSTKAEADSEIISTGLGKSLIDIKPKIGLVAYGSSSEDEDEENTLVNDHSTPSKESQIANAPAGQKRKLDDEDASVQDVKIPKLSVSENPIVGEAIEEELMIITGSGEGAQNDGGNESPSDSPLPPDLEEEIEHEQNSEDGILPPKPKGRGRPRKNPTKEVLKDKNVREKSNPVMKTSRRNSLNNDDLNGNASGPVRRSGRVAQIRQKEEEERRKLEEERLAQLKEAQVRKQQKQLERELKAGVKIKEPKAPKKPKGPKTAKHVTYIPSPSESGSESDNEQEEEEYVDKGKSGRKRRKKRSKNGKAIKRGANPWLHSSSEEDEAVEEEEEEHVDEEEEEELVFNGSDHEFSPESDIGEDSELSPSRHARTAKQKEVDKYAETYCDKCGKGDHPEWILLCDSCDKGWHGLCVNPQIWVIPEGEWFCPPCQHNMLVSKLSENLIEYEKILKKRENEVLRKQRLAYVGISLNNVLPSAEKPEKSDDENADEEKTSKRSSRRRRRLYSDDEDIEDFINDGDGDDDESGSGSGSYESEEEPIYQLRARRATKGFSFQEYDDMIKSALRDDDDEEIEEEKKEDEKPVEVVNNGEPVEKIEEEKERKESKGSDEDDEDYGRIGGPQNNKSKIKDDDTDEDELDEKEINRRKMLNQSQKKNRRRLNDLDATSEEDSDEDFKGSENDDDEEDEENVVEEDSDWSGGDESDDSIAMAKLAARKRKRHRGPLGRQERYSDGGTVRRSTRRRKSRITYDESDQEEDEEDQTEKWQSGESEASDSESESDDETWGKKKKKKAPPSGKSRLASFFLQDSPKLKTKKPKKKRRRTEEDEVDRAWSNKFGKKGRANDQPVERKTRGRQINFKDILDSGESDDDGNIRPKRRRIVSDSDDDSEEPSSSRKLAEEIRAANAKQMAEEKLQHEEKLRAQAAEKQLQNTNVIPSSIPLSNPPIIPKPVTATVTVPTILSSPEIASPMNNVEIKDKPVKITNSIVESILLRKSPDIPESPPSPLPRSISSPPNDPIMALPPLPPVPYLPSVLPSMTSGAVTTVTTGSARVGKKKTAAMLPTPASSSDVLPFPSKKSSPIATSAPLPPSKPVAPGMTTTTTVNSNISSVLPPNLPSDLTRIAGPMYGNNPALRSFHPAWGRNPPPYSGPPPPGGLGKPPPLNSSGFMGQSGQLRHPPPSSYGQQPSSALRIPNPSALQAFQQFSKRAGDVGSPSYRLPPSHQLPGSVLPSMSRERDRIFLGGNPPYSPYGMLPPQGQGQQHPALFAPPFEYRASPESFKDELIERVGGPPPPSGPLGVPLPLPVSSTKEEGTQGDGEFGGLVSYFSSQHSNDED